MSDARLSALRRVFAPLALAIAVTGFLFGWGDRRGKPIRGPCLVNGDCHATERCLVIPKSDGFATEGRCLDICQDDLQCPPKTRCELHAVVGQTVRPRRAETTLEGVCVAGVRAEGDGR